MLSVSVVLVSVVLEYERIHGEQTFLATSRISGMSHLARMSGAYAMTKMSCALQYSTISFCWFKGWSCAKAP